ncbi:MAG: Gfo/Idh/MocA family oxidoreductase [Thermoanaerobaculia bacterium]|nr:Gfo/Idh/MocA family oxidoreductase [Thermoanaerobaculia bacterium]
MHRLRIGVTGTGALGRHHVRLLSDLDGAELVGICDADPEAARTVAEAHGAKVFATVEELAGEVEAMVVAVPTRDHEAVAGPLLEAGRHVLVEKPITFDVDGADRLIAAAGDRVLAVGHVEFYNPAVQALVKRAGRPRFLEIQRLSVFTRRSLDIDVVLDLMIHDIQILHALDASPVGEVRAVGVDVLSDRIDIANARIRLASGCVANLTASRVSASRVRELRLFSEDAYYSLDYQEQSLKGFRLEGEAGARQISGLTVEVEKAEPLRRELEAFVAVCRGDEVPYVDGRSGRQALATALAFVAAAAEGGEA